MSNKHTAHFCHTGPRLLLPLLLWAVLLSACGGEKAEKLSAVDVPLERIVAVNVVSQSGDITVVPASGSTVRIEPSCTIEAATKERRQALRDNLVIEEDISDPSILTVNTRLGDAVSLREGETADIHLTVKVPQGVGSVILQSGAGDILVEKMDCAFSIVNNKGSVTVKNSAFTGKSSVTNVQGDIKIKLKDIGRAEEIRVTADLGDIKLNVPRLSSYTVTQEALSQKGVTRENLDGKTKIYLTTTVGKIDFQK